MIFSYISAVESYLATNKEGQLGVTGEGSLLENAQGKQQFQTEGQCQNTLKSFKTFRFLA